MIFEIKEWGGAISSFADRGIRGAFKMGANLSIRKTVDTLTCGQALKEEGLWGLSHSSSPSLSPSASASPSGSASPTQSASHTPSQSNSASTSPSTSKSLSPSGSASPSGSESASPSVSANQRGVYEDLVRFFVKATDGNTYGFGHTGFIYRRMTDGYTRNVYKDPDGEIKGAIEKPSDSGKTYLQWATRTKLKQKELPGMSDWSDVTIVAENLTGSDWHTMIQVGGANYIGNGSWLAMSGYDDSWTNEALDLIPGNEVKSMVERNGRAVIGTYKTGYPNKGTNAMIDCEYPLSQIGDDGDLYYADFTNSMPIKRFPGGGRVNPGGVSNEVDQINIFDWESTSLSWVDKQTLGNMSLWGVYNATSGFNGVYTYGRKNKEQPFTMNLEYALEVDEIGAVTCVEGTTIVSYRDGTDYGVKAVDATTKAVGRYESLEFRAPVKGAEVITTWSHAEVFMESLQAGTSIEMFYKMNKASDWTRAYTADGEASYDKTGGKKATFRIGAEGDLYEFKLQLNPTGNTTPTILRIRTYFN